jgi:hypothetical protein
MMATTQRVRVSDAVRASAPRRRVVERDHLLLRYDNRTAAPPVASAICARAARLTDPATDS